MPGESVGGVRRLILRRCLQPVNRNLQPVEHRLQIGGQRRDELDFLSRGGQPEANALGVEELAGTRQGSPASAAIDRIADDRVPDVGQVHPNLVRAAGERVAGDEGVARSEAPAPRIARHLLQIVAVTSYCVTAARPCASDTTAIRWRLRGSRPMGASISPVQPGSDLSQP